MDWAKIIKYIIIGFVVCFVSWQIFSQNVSDFELHFDYSSGIDIITNFQDFSE